MSDRGDIAGELHVHHHLSKWRILRYVIQDNLGELVRGTVEETLNAILDARRNTYWSN